MDNFDKLVMCILSCSELEDRATIATNLRANKEPEKSDAINIDQALYWSSTSQGHSYWSDIHDRLGEIWGYDYDSSKLFEKLPVALSVKDDHPLRFLSNTQQEY